MDDQFDPRCLKAGDVVVISGRSGSGKTHLTISFLKALGETTKLGRMIVMSGALEYGNQYAPFFTGVTYVNTDDTLTPLIMAETKPHPLNVLVIEDVMNHEFLTSSDFMDLIINSGPDQYNLLIIVTFQTPSMIPDLIISSATHYVTLGPYQRHTRRNTYKRLFSLALKPKKEVNRLLRQQARFDALVLDVQTRRLCHCLQGHPSLIFSRQVVIGDQDGI